MMAGKNMTKAKGRTIADLRATHDKSVVIPNRISAAIAALVQSGDEWIYECDFMKIAKPPISSVDISRYRDQFSDFWAEMPTTSGKSSIRRVWFATKKAADQWREVSGG